MDGLPQTRAVGQEQPLLELLQAQGRLSGSALAKRLGVDPRTVRRYIARLDEIGIPVTAERGRDGSYALVAGYKVPKEVHVLDAVQRTPAGKPDYRWAKTRAVELASS